MPKSTTQYVVEMYFGNMYLHGTPYLTQEEMDRLQRAVRGTGIKIYVRAISDGTIELV